MNAGADEVLEALRGAGETPCSGEDLSARLGVSRAQIWKHVGALRKRGYEIEGAPGGGYRLTSVPDRLYPIEIARDLETRWLGRTVHYLDTTDSTNRVALELAREGAPAGLAVVAEGQTAGRGRLGRSFFSPPYQNLYTSIVLRPSLSTADAPTLLLAAGVAVAEAVDETIDAGSAIEIKWPNDVLLAGLKTSGILMELGAEETRVSFAVLGIGVNLNVDPQIFPAEFRTRATSLRAHAGHAIDRVAFTRRLFTRLEAVLDLHAKGGLAAVRPRFDRYFKMIGREISVQTPGDAAPRRGIARGLSPDGALEVEGPDGTISRVIAGDVTLTPRGNG